MGQSKTKLGKKRIEWADDLAKQDGADPVQIPLQQPDGWFRGVAQRDIPDLLKWWAEQNRPEKLQIHCIDRFWIELIWETPKGNEKIVTELHISVDLNRYACENSVRNLEHHKPKDWEIHLNLFRQGNWGAAIWGWLNRYLFCYPIDPKRPHNKARIYPLIEAYEKGDRLPDEMTSFSYYGMTDTLTIKRGDDYEPPCQQEIDIFNDCLTILK